MMLPVTAVLAPAELVTFIGFYLFRAERPWRPVFQPIELMWSCTVNTITPLSLGLSGSHADCGMALWCRPASGLAEGRHTAVSAQGVGGSPTKLEGHRLMSLCGPYRA